MPFGIGPAELIVVLIVALLVVGPKRLPKMAKSLGHGMREFRDSVAGGDDDEAPATLAPAAPVASTPTVSAPVVAPAPSTNAAVTP